MLLEFSLSCNSGNSGCSTRDKSPKREILLNPLVVIFFSTQMDKFLSPVTHFGFPGAQSEKNPPAMRETWVWSLGWEDPLEEGMVTHSSILAWQTPTDRGAWGGWGPWGLKEWDPVSSLLLLLSRTSRAPSALLDTAGLKYEASSSVQLLSRVRLFATP